jgi:hypothetical protein
MDGSSAANAWAGWSSINWDTDGAGPDTGVGAGDTLYVMGTIRAASFSVGGYGLADDNRITILSYPATPGKLWQGKELPSGDWSGPDAYGAYSQTCVGSYSVYAYEWDIDPWINTSLTVMTVVPDATWTGTGLYYLDDGNNIAYYKPTSSVKNVTARSGTCRTLEFTSKSYITFSGLTISNQFKATSSSYLILEDMDITNQVSFYTACNNGIIRRCIIHDGSNGIYFINQSGPDSENHNNWMVENNIIYNMQGNSDSHGIGIQGGTGNIFQNNIIYNCGSGITFWNQTTQTMKDNTIRYNHIYHMGYYGDGDYRGIEFSGETGDSDLTTGNLIYYNIIEDCLNAGIRIKMGIPTTGYSIKAMNNVISDCYYSFVILPTNYESYEVGAYTRNNISYSPKTGGWHVYISSLGVTYNLSFDNNIYYGDGKFDYEGTTWTTLADWKINMSPQDANSLSTDPLFLSASNFHLQVGSPAINAGVNVGLTTDYAGNSVPQGAGFDIGAYEFLGVNSLAVGAGSNSITIGGGSQSISVW